MSQQQPVYSPEGDAFVIGVDVGTNSARAGVFDLRGNMLAYAKQDISVFYGPGSMAEQSSTEIWQAVCRVVRAAVAQAHISAERIVGLGFDATCSLVVLGPNGLPLAVGPSQDAERNVILWMDHRAVDQAARINQSAHPVLRYVGGKISPEMETPKLLWLKEQKPEVYARAWQFFDLSDFLTWRATDDLARSTCTLTCKWTYIAHEKTWDRSYFEAIGLGDLVAENYLRIGQRVLEPGTPLGHGLSVRAATELGLLAGTPVATGVIDAHAGGIGTVGSSGDPVACMAYVFGTSSCTMTSTLSAVFVTGVWGPYYSAMVPDTWLLEGGQSAAGAAIDHLLHMHPAATAARERAQNLGQSLPAYLIQQVLALDIPLSEAVHLTGSLHLVPEFLGNRAPFADPNARAIIAGLGMDKDESSLVAFYVAGVCSMGYGLRQIVNAQTSSGASVKHIMISGGAGRQDLVRQLLADTTGIAVAATCAEEPVLLGAAMLGSVAGQAYPNVTTAMQKMSRIDKRYTPATGPIADLHQRRFQVFERLQAIARDIR